MHLLTTLTQFFAAADASCQHTFFGLPPWFKYLEVKAPDCTVTKFTVPGDLTLVALAAVEILLRAAGLAAVGFVIYGGIQYVTSQGEPDKTKSALQTVINALVGLVIALVATATVSFVGNRIN